MTTEAAPRPPVTPPAAWRLPEPASQTLGCGARVLRYDVPGQYVLSVRVAVPLPLSAEQRDKEGVATIMARAMDEGTQLRSAEEMAELLERQGIAYGASVGESGVVLEVDVAKSRFAEAMALLAEIVRRPAFPPTEVERQVKTRLAEIERDRAQPPQRAALEFLTTYFEPSSRAARPPGGTSTSVAAITADDVRDLHTRALGPTGATFVVAGDLNGVPVTGVLDDVFGRWPAQPLGDAVATSPADRVATDAARIVIVDRPGSVQTEIHLGCAGPDRRDPDWAVFPLLGFVLGGSPTARVDAVLREDKGYTYGIRASFRPRRQGGLFVVTGSVRADVTVESVALLLGILDAAGDGFTDAETRAGADFITMTAPSRYATADALADEAATLALDGLTTSFVSDTLARLGTVGPADLLAAYRRSVAAPPTVVLVGDAAQFAEGVAALGRGDVSVVPA